MTDLTIRLEWHDDEGGFYMVTIAEKPGCVSDGKDVLHALVNIHDAMAAWDESDEVEAGD